MPMTASSDNQKRIDHLSDKLSCCIAHSAPRARLNHWTTLILMLVAVLSSAAAGIGGLFLDVNGRYIGALALVPGIAALAASTMKFHGKANWHYRKQYIQENLLRKLLYELSAPPTTEEVASISREWTAEVKALQEQWEKEFGLS